MGLIQHTFQQYVKFMLKKRVKFYDIFFIGVLEIFGVLCYNNSIFIIGEYRYF